jgi:hypothetical protein
VLGKQNINLAMWHTAMPSNTKPKILFNLWTQFVLVKKYILALILKPFSG